MHFSAIPPTVRCLLQQSLGFFKALEGTPAARPSTLRERLSGHRLVDAQTVRPLSRSQHKKLAWLHRSSWFCPHVIGTFFLPLSTMFWKPNAQVQTSEQMFLYPNWSSGTPNSERIVRYVVLYRPSRHLWQTQALNSGDEPFVELRAERSLSFRGLSRRGL